jgi:Uma2 family endonuclease
MRGDRLGSEFASREGVMATALDVRPGSLADFLAWEDRQPERYERIGGVVRMMTGGTIDHNVTQMLISRLQGSGCEVFISDVKVTTPAGDVMYPDVVVACGEIFGKATKLETPVVVVEVLSESTAERDHGRKRWAYQTIPSLRHYVLIDQNEAGAEVASRAEDGSWRSVIHRGLDSDLRLDALRVELGLDEIFAQVSFGPGSSDEQAETTQPSG